MQKESNSLLVSEAKELEDALTKTLYSYVEKAIDVPHAINILIENGLINQELIRNISICNDFDIMYKTPIKTMDIYYNLSVKYDLGVDSIRKIIRER